MRSNLQALDGNGNKCVCAPFRGGRTIPAQVHSASIRSRRRFNLDLQHLAGIVGERNAHLLAICNRGLNAGFGDEEIERRILEASGNPPLSVEEVRRAIAKAHVNRDEGSAKHGNTPAADKTADAHKARPAFAPQRGIVRKMIEEGHGTWDDLAALSPVALPDGEDEASRLLRAVTCVRTLYGARDRLCLGDLHSTTVKPREEWVADMIESPLRTWPERMGTNPFTGLVGKTTEGRDSTRCKATVATWRYALLEFDHLPLDDQRAFWIGIIRRHALPVAAITFSGSRSLHGLVRVDAETEAGYSRAWDKLQAFFASPLDPVEERCDTSCRDGSRMTRLPEASNVETGEVQSLLYLA